MIEWRLWAGSCIAAYALDLCLGDPPWLPHPVVAIGYFIRRLESVLHPSSRPARPSWPNGSRLSGLILLMATTLVTAATVAITLAVAARDGFWPHTVITVLWLWMAFATRSLWDHGETVRRALVAGDLMAARSAVARMVSRDVIHLPAAGVARACIESLSENLTDGFLSPLFFALLGGPVAAWGLKAVSTLDSMVGYRSPRYREFGWASARADDALNFLPARTLWLLLPVASWFAGASPAGCLRCMRNDAHHSPSPNSGLPEAGVAGTLDIELGGPAIYAGVHTPREHFNLSGELPGARDLRRAQRLVLFASALPILFLVITLLLSHLHARGTA